MSQRVETRIFVKITFNEKGKSALRECVYFRNEMMVDFYIRWKWYFEYRAALLRVKYPRAFIEYVSGPYQYELPDDKYKEKVKNRYLSDKRQLAKFKNKLNSIRKNWNELFPIEENPNYRKIEEKLNWYKVQADKSKQEYDTIF